MRAVLQLIADFTGLNLVASDTVQGGITFAPAKRTLGSSLGYRDENQGLSKRQMGSVLLIAPSAEIAARENPSWMPCVKVEEVAPLITEYIQLKYAKAAVLKQNC